MRIAKKRYEATDEQRWFSPPPCLIHELKPIPRPMREIDVAVKRINAVPKSPDLTAP